MASAQVRIGGVLADALGRGRERYNALFGQARLSDPGLDPEEFAVHLAEVVGPVVDEVAKVAPERIDQVVDALYEVSLDLLARELLGARTRSAAIGEAWRRILPAASTPLSLAPRRVVSAVSNAAYNLSLTAGAREAQWLDEMVAIGPVLHQADELLEAGRVIAWRSGMAHLRDGALSALARMRPEVATSALGVDYGADLHHLLEELSNDPWITPEAIESYEKADRRLIVRAVVGSFRGFGGEFRVPPTVIRVDGEFLVGDDEATWLLSADCFGATLVRAGTIDAGGDLDDNASSTTLARDGTVKMAGQTERFLDLARSTSWASDDTTLVVTLPFAHSLFVVALK